MMRAQRFRRWLSQATVDGALAWSGRTITLRQVGSTITTSASASSHHSLSLVYFILNIAESDFRHTQRRQLDSRVLCAAYRWR
jgi:hypothetical protein